MGGGGGGSAVNNRVIYTLGGLLGRGVVVSLKYSHCLALHKNRCRLLAILIWSSKNYCVLVSLEKIGQKEDDNGGDKAEVFLFHNVSVFKSFYHYYYWLQNWPPIPAQPPALLLIMYCSSYGHG